MWQVGCKGLVKGKMPCSSQVIQVLYASGTWSHVLEVCQEVPAQVLREKKGKLAPGYSTQPETSEARFPGQNQGELRSPWVDSRAGHYLVILASCLGLCPNSSQHPLPWALLSWACPHPSLASTL